MVDQEPDSKSNSEQAEEKAQSQTQESDQQGCLEIIVIGVLVLLGAVALVFGICLATF